MSFLTLDIETVPMWRFTEPDVPVDEKWREELLGGLECSAAGAIEAVNDALKSGEAKLKATGVQAALHASTSHVISVSWGTSDLKDPGEETSVWQWDEMESNDGGDEVFEAWLIERIFRAIHAAIESERTIVTFSGTGFDLPELRWRAAILGLDVPRIKWDGPPYRDNPAGLLYPFDTKTHCDLRLAWTNGQKYAKGTLADMSEAFGLENQESGAEVYEWFKARDWNSIRAYGHQEARNLIALYRACERIL